MDSVDFMRRFGLVKPDALACYVNSGSGAAGLTLVRSARSLTSLLRQLRAPALTDLRSPASAKGRGAAWLTLDSRAIVDE